MQHNAWERSSADLKARLSRLSHRARLRFVFSCIDHAVASLAPTIREMLGSNLEPLRVLRSNLELLWHHVHGDLAPDILDAAIAEVEKSVPDVDDVPNLDGIDGLVCLLTALYSALRCARRENELWNAEYSAENAYSAVEDHAASEFMRRHELTAIVYDASRIESESPQLLAEVAYQFDCLGRCERGFPISREWNPLDEVGS